MTNNRPICCACSEPKSSKTVLIEYKDGLRICELCINEGSIFIADLKEKASEKNIENLKISRMDMVREEVRHLEKPSDLIKKLDTTIIGQTNAKRVLAAAIYEHQKRLILNNHDLGDKLKKSNILLIGSSGSGKTLIAETLAKEVGLPIVIEDATKFSKTGYVGEDVESMLTSLVNKCGGDIKRAEAGGIVFIDEICKIAKRSGFNSEDPSGDGVQGALLKMVEGADVRISTDGSKRQDRGTTSFNTSNILFIASGAFDKIEKISDISSDSSSKIGLLADIGSSDSKLIDPEIKAEHIVKFGFKREFVGRFSNIVQLERLTIDDLKLIIKNPNYGFYQSAVVLADASGIKLSITDDAIDAIAQIAFDEGLGARSLDGIMSKVLCDFLVEAPDAEMHEFVITKELVDDKIK